MLRGACKKQKAIFKAEWPDGAPATLENVLRAVELGLDLQWGADHWFTSEALAEYNRQLDPLWEEYQRQLDPLWEEYQRQRATLLAEYQRQRATLLAEYQRQEAPLLAEYESQRAPIWAEYKRQLAPIWLAALLESLGAAS
jgi:hypothetical protein